MTPAMTFEFSEYDEPVDFDIEFYNVPDQRVLDLLAEVHRQSEPA